MSSLLIILFFLGKFLITSSGRLCVKYIKTMKSRWSFRPLKRRTVERKILFPFLATVNGISHSMCTPNVNMKNPTRQKPNTQTHKRKNKQVLISKVKRKMKKKNKKKKKEEWKSIRKKTQEFSTHKTNLWYFEFGKKWSHTQKKNHNHKR